MNARILLIALLLSTVAGCSWVKTIEVSSTAVERTQLAIPELPPVKTKLVQWFVITPENQEQIFKKLKTEKYNLVLFGLTDDGYENLSLNIAEIRKYIQEQDNILKAYKKYYEPVKSVNKKNKL